MSVSFRLTVYSCATVPPECTSSSAIEALRKNVRQVESNETVFTAVLSGARKVDADRHRATTTLNVKCRLISIFHELIKLDGIAGIAQRQPIHRSHDVT